jgi:diguanylate cyclase (GGDEF)-like protein
VSDAVAQQLGFAAFALLLHDDPRGDLVVRAAFGVDASAQGSRRAPREGVAGIAFAEKRVVLVRDLRTDPLTLGRTWLPGGDGSLLAVPMIHQGACVGVLDFWRPERDAFDDEAVRFLGLVADQAAMAISNARAHQRAVQLSVTDALTGVLNRRGLMERLRLELDRAERFGTSFALLVVDVDHLKRILEGGGLAAGDALVRKLARLLSAELRNVDVLARYRGDKFALVLPRTDRAAALAFGERLRQAVETAPFEPAGEWRVTVSVAVAVYPEDARDVASLVDAADAALFAAKRAGRNAVRAYADGMRDDPERPQKSRMTTAVEPEA